LSAARTKRLTATNALAYYTAVLVTTVNILTVQAPGHFIFIIFILGSEMSANIALSGRGHALWPHPGA